MNVIFVSGPHGCGKTGFMNSLLKDSDVFVKDEFYLDFVNDLPAIEHMSIFEKCLLRLYHRFYTAEKAKLECEKCNSNKIILVDRSIYDSMVYNVVEREMGTINEKQYSFLTDIAEKSLEIIKPYTIVLNPNSQGVVEYLQQRRQKGERNKRDFLCSREDTTEYISMMHNEYKKLESVENVLCLSGSMDENIQDTYNWIDKIIKRNA